MTEAELDRILASNAAEDDDAPDIPRLVAEVRRLRALVKDAWEQGDLNGACGDNWSGFKLFE